MHIQSRARVCQCVRACTAPSTRRTTGHPFFTTTCTHRPQPGGLHVTTHYRSVNRSLLVALCLTPRWPCGKASATRSGGRRMEPQLPRWSRTLTYHWYTRGYPARRLLLQGYCFDVEARLQCIVAYLMGSFCFSAAARNNNNNKNNIIIVTTTTTMMIIVI